MGKFERAFGHYAELIPDFPGFLDALRRAPPLHLRVNTVKATVADVVRALASQGVAAAPEPWCDVLLRLADGAGPSAGTTLLHALGHVYVQSASSAVAALALDARPGDRVLDLCAAPGSKTSLLAQAMEDRGCLVANEPSPGRLKSLTANLDRMGVTCALVTTYSGQNFPRRTLFDRVLVDAPCSGEGTWRGPEARPQATKPDFRAYLIRQQRGVLSAAYDLVRPGGTVVYSTCTYAPAENEGVVGPFLEETGASAVPLGVGIGGVPGLTEWEDRRFPPGLAHARRLYPHHFDSEGFFVVRLAKP
ncbi:MAG: RsmB/NOP family class I SAM-dependent RNA methyltransferase [Deltaproteobacteria bacterium]|nr:RsmB/NOP family class I SAM-dependent RNA methyltransferase [Deltaproteobacteria bacterium]